MRFNFYISNLALTRITKKLGHGVTIQAVRDQNLTVYVDVLLNSQFESDMEAQESPQPFYQKNKPPRDRSSKASGFSQVWNSNLYIVSFIRFHARQFMPEVRFFERLKHLTSN